MVEPDVLPLPDVVVFLFFFDFRPVVSVEFGSVVSVLLVPLRFLLVPVWPLCDPVWPLVPVVPDPVLPV